MSSVCYKGWAKENGNTSGQCCCNCEYRRPIVRHPWNSDIWAKGPVTSQMGWGCTPPDLYPEITFFSMDHSHGMCECHKWISAELEEVTKERERQLNEHCIGR